jgi:hypothetical protein
MYMVNDSFTNPLFNKTNDDNILSLAESNRFDPKKLVEITVVKSHKSK